MPQNPCPACGKDLPPTSLNLAEGVGLCPSCGKLSRLADIAAAAADSTPHISGPPPAGCQLDELGSTITLTASTRAIGPAIMMGAFCLFWNSMVITFTIAAFTKSVSSGTPPPAAPGTTNPTPGFALFELLFLVPFLLAGTALLVMTLMAIFGTVRVIIDGSSGSASTGVGPLRWTRRFDAAAVQKIGLSQSTYTVNGKQRARIELTADRTITFGDLLTTDRRNWLLASLRTLLLLPRPLR